MNRSLGAVRLASDDGVTSFRSGLLAVAKRLGVPAVRAGALSAAISQTARELLAEGRSPTIEVRIDAMAVPARLGIRVDGGPDRWRAVAERVGALFSGDDEASTLTETLPCRPSMDRTSLEELSRALHRRSRRALMRELRERNAELADTGAMLQSRVDAQTRDLLEAVEKAKAANEAKSQFLSSMSHELRTPLNGVLGYAQLLLRSNDVLPQHRRNLEAIESCGRHLLRLINDILDLSKIEAGGLEVIEEIVSLHELVARVGDIVRPRAEAGGSTLEAHIHETVPKMVRADATKLNQVLVNLMGNAAKFTEAGHIELRVGRDAEMVVFDVEDTGVGMTPEELERVFSPFAQGEGTGVRQGTGLGLTISRRLVIAMGGTLDATSAPGVGSTFSVRLPLEAIEGRELTEEATSSGLGTGTALLLAPGERCAALVVDDNETNRDVLESALTEAGFLVELAGDGREAIEAIGRREFRLVLMDIQMPVLDGVRATEIIRGELAQRDLVIIAVTASVPPNFRELIHDALFDDIVAKPFVIDDLLRRIGVHTGIRLVEAGLGEPAPRETTLPPTEIAPLRALAIEVDAELRSHLIEAVELCGINEIEAGLASLGEQHERFGPLVVHARQLLSSYDLDALTELFGGAVG